MPLTQIEKVRLKTSDKSTITRETTTADGLAAIIKLKNAPVATSPAPSVWQNDQLRIEGTHYTVDYTNGIITFNTTPVVNDELVFQYYWSIFSDDEVQAFLDEGGDNPTIAAAKLLMAWAADAAKLAKRQTLSGGGGLGQAIIDTSVVAKELRATAQAYLSIEEQLGESVPAEAITEVPWTEQIYKRQVDQHIIREN